MSLPPVEIPLGAMRFNSDSHKLEYFNGEKWFQIHTDVAASSAPRGWFQNLNITSPNIGIAYIDITTQGQGNHWGNLSTTAVHAAGACSSTTRGFIAGGRGPNPYPEIDTIGYWDFATQGNSIDFGNLTEGIGRNCGCSDTTRGITGAGQGTNDIINGWTMSSTGNAFDFGNLTVGRELAAALDSPTRGIFAGGGNGSEFNTIDYIIIQTTGNAVDFGDLIGPTRQMNGNVSSATRGVWAGGYDSPGPIAYMQYITMASTGNSQDFGDLQSTSQRGGGCSSSIRGVYALGYVAPTNPNTMEYITIATTGNSSDFGDLPVGADYLAGLSNGHGGLG